MTRSAMFFLGAGASADAGIPLARPLTQIMTDTLNSGRMAHSTAARALNFVIAMMLAHDSRDGSNPTQLPDIERVVSAVELLDKRGDLEVSPFISEWDATVANLEKGTAKLPVNFGRDLRTYITAGVNRRGQTRDHDTEKLIEKAFDAYLKGQEREIFRYLHRTLVQQVVDAVEVKAEKVDYLRPLVTLEPVDIATVNYDLSIELACESAQVPCARGVETWNETDQLAWPSTGVRLTKLHGSVDWEHRGQHALSVVTASERDRLSRPALVFGRREKLRARGPFLQLLEHFRVTLRAHTDLVVIGFSFSDEHLNTLMERWMLTGTQRRILVVDPCYPDFDWRNNNQRPALDRDYRLQRGRLDGRFAVLRETTAAFTERLRSADPVSVIDKVFASEAQALG